MSPEEFVNAVVGSGTSNFRHEDDMPDDYCPVHAWDHSYIGNLYHEDECPAYAAKLARLTR
jgi:hypothetical protein